MDPTSHDQNFKNLILDYPRLALAFFAPDEAKDIPPDAKITPLRQEQLKERLGDRFRELDTPLLIEFPNGEREAVVVVVEEDSQPNPWSLHRQAIYCLSVSELLKTMRVIAVAVHPFPGGGESAGVSLGTERTRCLDFHCFVCRLSKLEAKEYLNSTNVVERLCLPLMKHPIEQQAAVVSASLEGLLEFEPDKDKRTKYLAFIVSYANLDEGEVKKLRAQHAKKEEVMTMYDILKAEGKAEGKVEGIAEGIAKGKIEFILEARKDGSFTVEQARTKLKQMVERGEASADRVADALKLLDA